MFIGTCSVTSRPASASGQVFRVYTYTWYTQAPKSPPDEILVFIGTCSVTSRPASGQVFLISLFRVYIYTWYTQAPKSPPEALQPTGLGHADTGTEIAAGPISNPFPWYTCVHGILVYMVYIEGTATHRLHLSKFTVD